MARRALCLLLALAAAPALASPMATAAPPRVQLSAGFAPYRLGETTTLRFGLRLTPSAGRTLPPVTRIRVSYPADLGIATSGLGLQTCTAEALRAHGVRACPRNARMGSGSARVDIPFGATTIRERARIAVFAGPVQRGRLVLLFWGDGYAPLAVHGVFSGRLKRAPKPFGGLLDMTLPLTPGIPEDRFHTLVWMRITLGPAGITYVRRSHGRTIAYRPAGLLLPATCPPGGFRFGAWVSFLDGGERSARMSVPCPPQGAD
ncbi:MAG TPA: hypothetical protein VFS37_00415 [Conexibacter sp.]|nr:hypothetical protein [Conexibacter sp.]